MNKEYIEESINEIFQDCSFDVKDHLIKCFDFFNENEFVMEFFEILCNIKREHPKFIIEFIKENYSEFNSDNEKISLGRKNYLILIHEIGHVIHYYYNQYSVSDNFNNLQVEVESNLKIFEKCNILIHTLDERIKKISSLALDTSISDEEYDKMLIEQKCYLEMKDFIDAFFKGKTDSGHAQSYYLNDDDNKKSFSEMFATYISIKSFDQSGKLTDLLNKCLGENLIEIFEKLYNEIREKYIINIKKR